MELWRKFEAYYSLVPSEEGSRWLGFGGVLEDILGI